MERAAAVHRPDVRAAGRADRRLRLCRAFLVPPRDAGGQGYVVRETWGWMHYGLYVGFVGLAFGTTIVLINSDIRALFALVGIPVYFYYGDFYLFFKAF